LGLESGASAVILEHRINKAEPTWVAGTAINISKPYLAYLLRLWRVRQGGASEWMASLESTSTGERQGFASLEAMVAYLNQAMAQAGDPQVHQEEPGKEAASNDSQEDN
jgi:hypothetical protein